MDIVFLAAGLALAVLTAAAAWWCDWLARRPA
jgi:hypothetical protein